MQGAIDRNLSLRQLQTCQDCPARRDSPNARPPGPASRDPEILPLFNVHIRLLTSSNPLNLLTLFCSSVALHIVLVSRSEKRKFFHFALWHGRATIVRRSEQGEKEMMLGSISATQRMLLGSSSFFVKHVAHLLPLGRLSLFRNAGSSTRQIPLDAPLLHCIPSCADFTPTPRSSCSFS